MELTHEDVLAITPSVLRTARERKAADCDVDLDEKPAPPNASQALLSCLDQVYLAFLIVVLQCGDDCECKRQARANYEADYQACIETHGS